MLTNSQVSDRHIANIAHKGCRSAAHQAQVAQEALWHWALGLVEGVVLHHGLFSTRSAVPLFVLSPFTIFSRGPPSSRSHRHLPCFWLSSDLVPFCLFSAIAGQVRSNPRKDTRCRPFRADADASLIQLRVDHNPHSARWAGPTSRANCPERTDHSDQSGKVWTRLLGSTQGLEAEWHTGDAKIAPIRRLTNPARPPPYPTAAATNLRIFWIQHSWVAVVIAGGEHSEWSRVNILLLELALKIFCS